MYETSEKLDTNATDIGSALEYAATLLPENKAGHIILLSDGKQTDGDAMDTVQYLKSKGIRVDGVYFDTTQFPGDEVQLGSITTPEGAYVGDALSFVADVQSNVDT